MANMAVSSLGTFQERLYLVSFLVRQLSNSAVSSLCTFQERLYLVSFLVLYVNCLTVQWVLCVQFRRDCTNCTLNTSTAWVTRLWVQSVQFRRDFTMCTELGTHSFFLLTRQHHRANRFFHNCSLWLFRLVVKHHCYFPSFFITFLYALETFSPCQYFLDGTYA